MSRLVVALTALRNAINKKNELAVKGSVGGTLDEPLPDDIDKILTTQFWRRYKLTAAPEFDSTKKFVQHLFREIEHRALTVHGVYKVPIKAEANAQPVERTMGNMTVKFDDVF